LEQEREGGGGGGGANSSGSNSLRFFSHDLATKEMAFLDWTGASSYLHFHPFWAFNKQQGGHNSNAISLYLFTLL
jgi:hypothetical protein